METEQIDGLKAIAQDETLSSELRTAAAEQLMRLGITEPIPQSHEHTEPTPDFVYYRLRPIWNKLREPKPELKHWLRTDDCKERIRKHDAVVSQDIADTKAGIPAPWPPLNGRFRAKDDEFSFCWEHPTYSFGGKVSIPEISLRLRGQDEA